MSVRSKEMGSRVCREVRRATLETDTHRRDVRNPEAEHSAGLNEKGGEVDGRRKPHYQDTWKVLHSPS